VTLHRTAVQNAEVTLTMVSNHKRQGVERLLDDMREDLTLLSIGVPPMANMIIDRVEGGQPRPAGKRLQGAVQ